jgi:hypothetical protein
MCDLRVDKVEYQHRDLSTEVITAIPLPDKTRGTVEPGHLVLYNYGIEEFQHLQAGDILHIDHSHPTEEQKKLEQEALTAPTVDDGVTLVEEVHGAGKHSSSHPG